MSERTKGIYYVLITVLLWGTVLPFALHFSLRFGDVASISWFRFLFSTLLLGLAFGAFKIPPPSFENWKAIVYAILAGVALAFNYLGYFKGIELTTPSNAQIIIQFSPLLFALMGIMFFGEILTRIRLLGFSIAMVGFFLFYKDQITALIGSLDQYNSGILYIIAGSVAWATYAVFNKLAIRSLKPQQSNLVIFGVATLVTAPLCNFSTFDGLSMGTWILFCALGLITLIAYGALGESMKRIPATTVSIIITTNPILTLAVATLLTYFNVSWVATERFTIVGVIGASLVILGACLVVGGTPRKQVSALETTGNLEVDSSTA